jgi:hypothetical protein
MLGLIESDLASARKQDFSERTPSFFMYLRTRDALPGQSCDLRLQIVTHEIEFVPVILCIGMYRDFAWRQRENQPSTACVY